MYSLLMLYLYRRKRIPLTSLVKGILLFNWWRTSDSNPFMSKCFSPVCLPHLPAMFFNWSRREVTILAIRGPQPRVYPSTLLRGIL